MANLTFNRTGLPFVVWILPRGNARHDVRVKVSPGPRMTSEMVSVAVRPEVRVMDGEMETVELNRNVLVRYWDGDIEFTEDALAALLSI